MGKSYFLKNLLYKVAAVENLIKMRIKCICLQWYCFSFSGVIILEEGVCVCLCVILSQYESVLRA